jgi:hypothetical protein
LVAKENPALKISSIKLFSKVVADVLAIFPLSLRFLTGVVYKFNHGHFRR